MTKPTLGVALWITMTGCGGAGEDRPPDSPALCDPATVLPSSYRLIASVSTGAVKVATAGDVTSGTIDATAGGMSNAADNPYVYVDLQAGMKVAISDLDARASTNWDIALKRSSLRTNSGDSGPGNRELAVVQAATLGEVSSAPASGYTSDDFVTDDCMLDSLLIGEPRSAFGEWYDYEPMNHVVTPRPDVYVIKRNNDSKTAFRIKSYYGDPKEPTLSAFYSVEWKSLP